MKMVTLYILAAGVPQLRMSAIALDGGNELVEVRLRCIQDKYLATRIFITIPVSPSLARALNTHSRLAATYTFGVLPTIIALHTISIVMIMAALVRVTLLLGLVAILISLIAGGVMSVVRRRLKATERRQQPTISAGEIRVSDLDSGAANEFVELNQAWARLIER